MLIGYINYAHTYALLTNPTWKKVFTWLSANQPAPGEHEIQGRDIYANAIQCDTIPRTQGVFESHQEYIDIHYCVQGEEIIEWLPVEMFTNQTEANPNKDYALFAPVEKTNALHLTPGMFAIFMPGEAHMPKLAVSSPVPLFKIVVKVNRNLL